MADVSKITANGVTYDIKDSTARAALENKILTINIGAISSLPQSFSSAKITSDMVVLNIVWGNPSAVGSNITWTTSNGRIDLSGTLIDTTTASLTLGKSSYT